MVIFNSYVKLPEGKGFEFFLMVFLWGGSLEFTIPGKSSGAGNV